MQRAHSARESGPVSEMSIVDTFTKLIFGENSDYSNCELRIIQAFRAADPNVLLNSHRDMGGYLRAMGVREMIELVGRVRQQLLTEATVLSSVSAISRLGGSALNRRAH